MGYATYSDLLSSFGEGEVERVTDRDRDGSPDDGVIAEGLAFADDHIDGYLRSRYTLPLTVVPRNLVGFACDFARYRFYQDQPTELVQLRYDMANAFLRDVARGLVDLDIGLPDVETPSMAHSLPTAVFTKLVW